MGLIKVLNTWWGIMVEACKYKNYAFQDPDLGLCNRVLFLHNLVGGRGKYLSKIFYCSKWIRNQYWMSSLHNRLVFYFCFCSSIRSLTDTDYYGHYHIWARPWFWAFTLEVINLDLTWTICSAMTIVSETIQICCDCERPPVSGNIRVWWQITLE